MTNTKPIFKPSREHIEFYLQNFGPADDFRVILIALDRITANGSLGKIKDTSDEFIYWASFMELIEAEISKIVSTPCQDVSMAGKRDRNSN